MAEDHRPPSPDRAEGMAKMQEVYNFSVDPDAVPGDFVAYTVDHLFGDVWRRPGLSTFERRLVTIGVLAALGKTELLDVQFQSALDNGELTEAQVRELVVHLAHYVGWPLATGANEAAERVIGRRRAAGGPGSGGGS
ncbi:MAG TPA: carboxymuconolactone decarboxylase family protein [Acidimicrobiales bacterium]|nr:carboxymuconolactone decarboxylase family protein [Acidimicrobiales bacterium]